jgi:hypothetical protein
VFVKASHNLKEPTLRVESFVDFNLHWLRQTQTLKKVFQGRGLYYKTFYGRNLLIFVISQIVSGKPFQPSLMFVCKVGTYPSEDNIRLGWKGLPETNTS